MEHSIYEFPHIFRRVHMEKPEEIVQEAEFLEQVWRRYLARPVRRVLDVASGDSPHGLIFARAGREVVGIDRSPTMIAAGRRAAIGRAKVKFYRRAIDKFEIPERRFDAAIFMSETFPIMISNDALLSHLESVARMLRRGSLYCIDIDRHDGVRLLRKRRLWRRRQVVADGAAVEVREYLRPFEWYEPMHSLYELECRLHFSDRIVTTRDLVPTRYIVPSTMDLLARASRRFEMVAAHADLSFEMPLEKCERRWLAVLRRI